MQAQRLLGSLDEFGNLDIASNRQAAFGRHDLGGCLKELLGRTDGSSQIVRQGAPDAFQLGADPRWVAETGQRCLKRRRAAPVDPAALIELKAIVVQQLPELIETAGPVPLLAASQRSWDSNTRSARSTEATSVQSTPAA
jgi:hypothetical protein